MDFEYTYTDEQQAFRSEVRGWLEQNIPQEMQAPVDPLDLSEEQYRFWREAHLKIAAQGWLHPTYPKEYGGGGLSGEHETIILEEFERIRTVAAPLNAKRHGWDDLPCATTNDPDCETCTTSHRQCNSTLIHHNSRDPERINIVLVNKDLGY